ncbi:hypothetical protein [Corynebacterium parakroppenstedtii]|uniref:hypothetical protein n=1 Tax=Corynebacterium parakroppenstedtii TaxID=2828363 RepID=UPI001C8F2046|nr:hypothetical protein [Corynebacterium parakroppenstedtii]MBY0794746.1 hypothetical protein [Corynebacterium parakroppenstedtii]
MDPSVSITARSSSRKKDKRKPALSPRVETRPKLEILPRVKTKHIILKLQTVLLLVMAQQIMGIIKPGQETSDNHQNEAPGTEENSIPEPTADELLHSVLAASDDSLSSSQHYFYAPEP